MSLGNLLFEREKTCYGQKWLFSLRTAVKRHEEIENWFKGIKKLELRHIKWPEWLQPGRRDGARDGEAIECTIPAAELQP